MFEVGIYRDKIKLSTPEGLSESETEVRNLIASSLTFKKKDYFFSQSFQSGRWDGQYHLYHIARIKSGDRVLYTGHGDWYSSGFLTRTLGAWKRAGANVVDYRDLPPITIDETRPSYTSLRPYQQEAVHSVYADYVPLTDARSPRGIIWLPPRTGKTRTAAAIIDQAPGARPVVFVVERIDLARQTVDAFTSVLDGPIGLIGDGACRIEAVTVATIQSLHQAFGIRYEKAYASEYIEKRIEAKIPVMHLVRDTQMIFGDEGHHATAFSYREVFSRAANAWCRILLSGTPWTDDGSDLLLEEIAGPIIFKRSRSFMVANDYLLPIWVTFYTLPKIECYSGHYQAIYKSAVVKNPVKNYLIAGAANELVSNNESVAIMTVQKQHARDIARKIEAEVVVLTGDERGVYRKDVYDKLNRKELLCIVSTVFSEGIDVPTLNAGINADGGLDSRRMEQRLRMGTPAVDPLSGEPKRFGRMIDFLHREKHLKTHANRRLKYFQGDPSFRVDIRDHSDELKIMFMDEVAFV